MGRLVIFLLGVSCTVLQASTARTAIANELDWKTFEIDGRPAFTILPKPDKIRDPMPWVFYAPTFDASLPNEQDEGWMMTRFLEAGIAIAGVDVGESYGSPKGRTTYNALHAHLTSAQPKFAPQACLLARSRGGLMLYSWAAENPDKVRCIAGIYPVCDLRSYPGLAKACGAFGLTKKELGETLAKNNPIERLESLAKAKVPILHIHGDVDTLVPLEANSGALAERYRKLGGQMELIIPPGQGHNMWRGFFECEPLVQFVIDQANGIPKRLAHWKLDEIEGNVATDSAGGHHGEVFGATPVEGRKGGARLFDRSEGNHIVVPHSKDFELSSFTVASWLKLTRPPTFSGILGTRFGKEYTFDMKVNDAKVHGDIGDGAKWIETKVNFYANDTGSNDQGGDLDLNRWHQIVFVVDGQKQKCRLYLDADLKKVIPFQGKPRLMQEGQRMHIGNSSTDEFMDGVIDEVSIWPTALSTEQIQTLYRFP